MDTITKEIQSRKSEIENDLESILKKNLKITDWNIPEADDKKAAGLIMEILEEKLANMKQDVESGVYDFY